MYLGIDLGTSNSAIVGNNGGEVRLFKTADGRDVLPSVLFLDKRGHRFVGTKAYDQKLLSPQNVVHGFKRLMGTKTPLRLGSADGEMTPEEASAEILRTLLAQARTEIGDFELEGAVVTVPAAFNQMQSEATIRSAQLAGLERVGLLQEPIAAAMASLEKATNKDGQFLVYDLGGGTFDVALVQSIKGAVTILAHEGINALGGTDIDKSIMNSVIRPWLLEKYDLPDDFHTDPQFKRLLAIARAKGELAKIELSANETSTIFVSEDEGRSTDHSGEEIYIEIPLTRERINELVHDQISETIELCQKILTDNHLSNDDIDRVVLIGGPSKMPAVRDRVPRELGIAVDLNTDPMTAVARGAAIHAESRVWQGTVSERKSNKASKQAGSELQVKYDFEARTTSDEARIKAVVVAGDAEGFTVAAATADGRETGNQSLSSSPVIKVQLERTGENVVRVTISDSSGRPVPEASAELVITKVVASSTGAPASQTIAVKTVTGASGLERNVLKPLLNKGEMLPKSGTQTFRAAKDLRAGSGDQINVELFQQADGVIEPEYNLFIGSLSISAELLEEGQILRKGNEVRLHWRADDNGLITASVEVPELSIHVADHKIYVDNLGHQDFDGEEGKSIVGEILIQAERDVERLEEDLGAKAASELAELRRRLRRLYDDYALCSDADGFRKIAEEARHVRQECSRLRHSDRFRKDSISADLSRMVSFTDGMTQQDDANRNPRMAQLIQTTKHSLADGQFEEAERALEELRSVTYSMLRQEPAFVIGQFQHLSQARHHVIDPALHERLIAEGIQAIDNEDLDELRSVISRMFENQASQDDPMHDLAALAHLAAH